MFEGIDLADRSFDLISELMRSNALNNTVVLVSENNISLGVKLQYQVICESFAAKA